MKKFLLVLVAVICVLLPLVAQNSIRITGTVLDKTDNSPVEEAGIRILKARDSTYVTGMATDEAGKFLAAVTPGKYIVCVSYLGYKDNYINVDATKNSVAMDNILMSANGIMLKEAVVTAKAAEIAVKGDTVEYNADSYKTQPSAVVEDLVKKMPGAEVDANGKITINGKEIKKILVDGKEFFSDDPKVASKNLPAAMVDKLQVLDRKSDMAQMTGFDDGDDETVINLTVKKGMKQGVFGNAYAGMGNEGRYEANAMVNYMQNENQFTLLGGSNNTNNAGFSDFSTNTFSGMRPPRGINFGGNNGITQASNGGFNFALNPSKKFKWGGNIRYGSTDNNVETDSYTQYRISADEGGNQYKTEKAKGNNIGDNFGANLRFEWRPDSSTTVIFTPNIQYNKNENGQVSNFLTTHQDANDSINWGKADYYSQGTNTALSGTLDVSRTLGKKGRVLSVSLSGGFNDLDNKGYNKSETYYSDPNTKDNIIDQQFTQKNNTNNWSAYVSYVEPITSNNFLQLAYTYRKSHSESDKDAFKNDGSGNYTIIDTLSTKVLENNFINQQIEANFKSVHTKYNYTVGFALQPSNSDSWTTFYSKTPVETPSYVLNFAPVAQFNYMWNKRKNLRIDYKGNTTAPTTTQLAASDFSDPSNIVIGNPDLNPSFDHRLRVRYQEFNPEKASAFMVFAGANYTINDIVNTSIVNEQGQRESTYKNVNGNWGANARVIMNRPLRNKKFSINSMTYGNYNQTNGFVNGDKNTADNFTFTESLGTEFRSDLFDFGLRGNFSYNKVSNSMPEQPDRETFNYGGYSNATLHLPYDLTLDTDMTYAANSGYSAGFQQNQWLWNASLAKQIFKAKNGTIRFKIYDILQQRSNISQTNTAQYLQETITNTIGSYFMVHFIYRFQIFKGGAKMSDMGSDSGPRFGPPGGGERPPR